MQRPDPLIAAKPGAEDVQAMMRPDALARGVHISRRPGPNLHPMRYIGPTFG